MPQYRYQSRSDSGTVQVGVLVADNAASAAAELRRNGHHVLQLAPMIVRTRLAALQEKLAWSSGPSRKDILDFTTQLAVMIRAGISIRQALEGISEQATNVRFRRILKELKSDIESGKQFSESIAKHERLFGPLYISMVRASEMSGTFAHMLDRIAAYLQQELETRKMVVGASIYPGIIALMASGVTIFMLTFVLPRFAGVFEGKEEVLPGPTRFLMSLSDFMVEWWWVILIVLGVCIGSLIAALRTEVGAYWLDRVKLATPVAKRMFRALYISRSLHTFGELINAGVPLLDTISITGDISGNRMYRSMWRSVHASVQQGKTIQSQLTKSKLLPRSVIQMISAGEESGRLGEVLEEVSGYYHRLLKDVIKTVTSMIEPIMIVLMGSVVGFIAMAIILPIFKMSSLVSG